MFLFFKKVSHTSRMTKNELLKHLNQSVKVYSVALKKYKCFQKISNFSKRKIWTYGLYILR